MLLEAGSSSLGSTSTTDAGLPIRSCHSDIHSLSVRSSILPVRSHQPRKPNQSVLVQSEIAPSARAGIPPFRSHQPTHGVPARSGKTAYLSVRAGCSDFLTANRIKRSKSPTVARRPNANCLQQKLFQQKLFQQISSETLNV